MAREIGVLLRPADGHGGLRHRVINLRRIGLGRCFQLFLGVSGGGGKAERGKETASVFMLAMRGVRNEECTMHHT